MRVLKRKKGLKGIKEKVKILTLLVKNKKVVTFSFPADNSALNA